METAHGEGEGEGAKIKYIAAVYCLFAVCCTRLRQRQRTTKKRQRKEQANDWARQREGEREREKWLLILFNISFRALLLFVFVFERSAAFLPIYYLLLFFNSSVILSVSFNSFELATLTHNLQFAIGVHGQCWAACTARRRSPSFVARSLRHTAHSDCRLFAAQTHYFISLHSLRIHLTY